MSYLFTSESVSEGHPDKVTDQISDALIDNFLAFDPNSKIQEDKLKILIATDILSEGVNLHRANVTINYDIPWNSVKILQRVGRVNRIGSQNDIYIYNFFPTEKAEEEIRHKKEKTGNKNRMPAPDAEFIARGYENLSKDNKQALKKFLQHLRNEDKGK